MSAKSVLTWTTVAGAGSQGSCSTYAYPSPTHLGQPLSICTSLSVTQPLPSNIGTKKQQPFCQSWPYHGIICVTTVSAQLLNHVQLCDPMNCSTPGLPVYHQLPESTQTHVHRVGDAIQPSHPLSYPSPALNLSQHQALFQ